LRKIIEKIA